MRKGFTLIEIMVSLTLFAAIVAIAVGGFARALHTQHEVTALVAAQSNAGLALEQMAREMRTGYLFCVTTNSTAGNLAVNPACSPHCGWAPINNNAHFSWICDSFLTFYNAQSIPTTYSLGNGSLLKNGTAITGDNTKISYLRFMIFGQLQGDHWSPRITIAMGVAPSTTDPSIQGDVMDLQTTVSAREPDAGNGVGY